jgi:hypothetical protein
LFWCERRRFAQIDRQLLRMRSGVTNCCNHNTWRIFALFTAHRLYASPLRQKIFSFPISSRVCNPRCVKEHLDTDRICVGCLPRLKGGGGICPDLQTRQNIRCYTLFTISSSQNISILNNMCITFTYTYREIIQFSSCTCACVYAQIV